MKKISMILGIALGIGYFSNSANAQAVRDRNVVPVAVNLNEVLRMTITNGGNIEFVFNSIDDYRFGLSADVAVLDNPQDADVIANGAASNPAATTGGGSASATNFYKTDFHVAASVRWAVDYGAENAAFVGTDDPNNTLALDNVGFALVNNGAHTFEATTNAIGTSADPAAQGDPSLFSGTTDNANSVTALQVYPITLIEDNDDPNDANAGDQNDNSFTILWRCGTTEEGNGENTVVPMNAVSLLNQGDINPDRYVTNVVFELRRDF
jgi:hypothetical protein